jgi:hypothetical protein
MPKQSKPGPVLYEWDEVSYFTRSDYSDPTGGEDLNTITFNADGTWVEVTQIDGAEGSRETSREIGTITRKELRELDRLIDQVNRDPYDPTQVLFVQQDEPFGATVEGVAIGLVGQENDRQVLYDDPQNNNQYYTSAFNQTDVQEAEALKSYLAVLDARYGDNFV